MIFVKIYRYKEKALEIFPLQEIQAIRKVLEEMRREGTVLLAYLYGSYAKGTQHPRSDIDIAVYFDTESEDESIEAIDRILMATDRTIEILLLNDPDESPFVIQEALKGIPLVEPDVETLYMLSDYVLHETESVRYKRELVYET
jgi:predicted nucleotidyltransferase